MVSKYQSDQGECCRRPIDWGQVPAGGHRQPFRHSYNAAIPKYSYFPRGALMPRKPKTTAAKGDSVSSYFRVIFKENRQLLKSKSNDEIFARWLADHPGEKEVPDRVKYILSKVKSDLRHQRRNKMKKKKEEAVGGLVAHRVVISRVASPEGDGVDNRVQGLERLEEAIDGCLTMARGLDEKKLDNAIVFLRRARREVVWQLG
jgi:hypothetical protein